MLAVLVLALEPRGAQGQAVGATLGMSIWQHPTWLYHPSSWAGSRSGHRLGHSLSCPPVTPPWAPSR